MKCGPKLILVSKTTSARSKIRSQGKFMHGCNCGFDPGLMMKHCRVEKKQSWVEQINESILFLAYEND